MSRRNDIDCKIYVGDLARDTNEKDVERSFGYYGRLRSVWVARNPAGFAFVEFEDPRDADDAVRGLDGTNVNGSRIRVEHSTGKVRPKPWMSGGRGRGGGGGGGRDGGGGGGGGGGRGGGRRAFHPEDRCYECGEPGHYAYDCSRQRGGGGGGGRSSSRRYSRSRSRSRSRGGRRSYSRSRSRSREYRRGGRDRSRERNAGRSASRSRSRSAGRNDN